MDSDGDGGPGPFDHEWQDAAHCEEAPVEAEWEELAGQIGIDAEWAEMAEEQEHQPGDLEHLHDHELAPGGGEILQVLAAGAPHPNVAVNLTRYATRRHKKRLDYVAALQRACHHASDIFLAGTRPALWHRHVLLLMYWLSRLDASDYDDDTQRVAETALAPGRKIVSKILSADRLGVDRKKQDKALILASAVAYAWDLSSRVHLAMRVSAASAELRLVAVLDIARYDEASFPVRAVRTQAGNNDLPQIPVEGSNSSLRTLLSAVDVVPKDDIPGKVLQIEGCFALLLANADGYFVVRGPALQTLRLIASTNTQTMVTTLQDASSAVSLLDGFTYRCRLACSDDAKPNIACEPRIVAERDDWSNLRLPCRLHKIATCHSRTFSLVDGFISGLINMSLSLQIGIGLFRKLLRDQILRTLRLLPGSPPRHVVEYRRSMLKLLLGGRDAKNVKRARILDAFASGDWKDTRCVECYLLGDGVVPAAELETVKKFIAGTIAKALCPSVPRLYPRSRWSGADVSFGDIAVLEACHSLLTHVYPAWADQIQARTYRARQADPVPCDDGGAADILGQGGPAVEQLGATWADKVAKSRQGESRHRVQEKTE